MGVLDIARTEGQQVATVCAGNGRGGLEALTDGFVEAFGAELDEAPGQLADARLRETLREKGLLDPDPVLDVASRNYAAQRTGGAVKRATPELGPQPAAVCPLEATQHLGGHTGAHGLAADGEHVLAVLGMDEGHGIAAPQRCLAATELRAHLWACIGEAPIGGDLGDHLARVLGQGAEQLLALP